MDKSEISLNAILEQGMLPLYFHPDKEVTIALAQTLYGAGVRVFEYTNRGAAALENFTALKKEVEANMPDLDLGIGTIKTLEQAKAFIDSGADFIVSPIVNEEVAKICNENKLLWIPGCMTPTEISVAQANQAKLIKIFPANILGPDFISSIKDLFAGQLFIPTGGVDLTPENIKTWFNVGVCAVGMGSKLISSQIMKNRDYELLAKNTKEVLAVIQSIK